VKRAVLSELAEGDLADIWIEIARDQIENADRFLEELRQRLQTLAEQPLIGRERPDIAPGVRSFAHHEYLILYRASGDGAAVARVVHGRRYLPNINVPRG